MMGPVSKRDMWIVGILAFIAINLTVAWHFYERGKYSVALKSTQDSLAVVQKAAKGIQKSRDSLTVVLLADHAQSDASTATAEKSKAAHEQSKEKVTLHGDTAVTKDSSQVLLPEVADRLQKAETRATDAEKSAADLKKENTDLRFTLHADTLAINNLKDQVALNERIAKMVQGPSHFSHGIQIGVGETLSSDGVKRASIYVGYGVQIRTP